MKPIVASLGILCVAGLLAHDVPPLTASTAELAPEVWNSSLSRAAAPLDASDDSLDFPEMGEVDLPADCVDGLDDIDAEVEDGALGFELPEDYSIEFTCGGGVANAQFVDDESGEMFGAAIAEGGTSDGEVIDLTEYIDGSDVVLSDEDRDGMDLPEVELDWMPDETGHGESAGDQMSALAGSPAVILAGRNDTYHMSANHRAYWGVKSHGKVVWSRSTRLFLRTTVGGYTKSWLTVTSTPAGRYQISFEGTAHVRRHLRGMLDVTHDSALLTQRTYSSNTWSNKASLLNARGAGKYYQVLTNIKINDRSKGRKFNVSNSFTMPRFQCYKTVVCKFPGGKPAPY